MVMYGIQNRYYKSMFLFSFISILKAESGLDKQENVACKWKVNELLYMHAVSGELWNDK